MFNCILCKEISACAERSDQGEILAKMFLFFFFSNSHFRIALSSASSSTLQSHCLARAFTFFLYAIGKINCTCVFGRQIDCDERRRRNGRRAQNGSEFEEKKVYNSMGPVQVLVKFTTSSTFRLNLKHDDASARYFRR